MNIPGFPLEKSTGWRELRDGRQEVESTAVEENAGAIVSEGTKAARGGFDLLIGAVEAFGDREGEIGEQRSEVLLESLGDVFYFSPDEPARNCALHDALSGVPLEPQELADGRRWIGRREAP